jgi:hypothetical protein
MEFLLVSYFMVYVKPGVNPSVAMPAYGLAQAAKPSKNSMRELAFDSCVSITSPVLLSPPSFHLTYLIFFFFSLYCYLVCGVSVL